MEKAHGQRSFMKKGMYSETPDTAQNAKLGESSQHKKDSMGLERNNVKYGQAMHDLCNDNHKHHNRRNPRHAREG